MCVVFFFENFLKTECTIIDFSIKKGTSPMYCPNQEVVNYLIDQLADKKMCFRVQGKGKYK